MKILTVLKLLLVAAIAAAGAYIVWQWHSSPEADDLRMREAKIREVRGMVELCSMEIYDEVPVKGHIGKRNIFAKMTLKGSVNFDIENLSPDLTADTVRIALPPERVDVLESTDDNSYTVIDTWNTSFLGSDHFTTAEENAIKDKVRAGWIRRVYANGTVARARAEARQNLAALLRGILGKPVVVYDPTPRGASYNIFV